MEAEQPRIQIETREDILFVKDQLRQAAKQSLTNRMQTWNEKMDSTTDSNNGLTTAVEKEFEKFIEEVFTLASNNITVNGVSMDEAFKTVENFEPLDDSIRLTAESLMIAASATRTRLARFRTTLPFQLRDKMKEEIEKADSSFKSNNSAGSSEEGQMDGMVVDFSSTAELQNVAETMIRDAPSLNQERIWTLSMLSELKKIAPVTRSKWERSHTLMNDLGIDNVSQKTKGLSSSSSSFSASKVPTPTSPRRARSGFLKLLQDQPLPQ
ncbi:hypothetical protein HDU76_002459 [Blyttiomyces sp. JEL0837]|nr:hypothetical protein HDU76_002459 [Blyttiomyces sp. JEL0837]